MKLAHAGHTFVLSSRYVARGGDDTKLVLQKGSGVTRDEFGVDQLVRKWSCRSDLADSHLADYGDTDFVHRALRLWDHSIDHGEGFRATITERYNGFIKPRPVQEKREGVTQERSVNIQHSSKNATLAITYKAPTTVIRYAVPAEPTKPRFAGVMLKFDDAYQILNRRGSSRDRLQILTPRSSVGDGFVVMPTIVGFMQKTPQGHIWLVTETNEGRLIEPMEGFFSTADIPHGSTR